ncbi:MAG: GNAT family N-acetyltransferase [Chloroflexi bacterium]|nr:GNAT family N-acetyltransferase [Chloroflexota bacterium]
MTDIVFKTVKDKKDIDMTANLADKIWHEYYCDMLLPAQIDYMVSNFQSTQAITSQINQGYEYYIMYDGDVALGYFAVEKKEGYFFISKIYITQAFRRQGYGKAAMYKIADIAKNYGYKDIRLSVHKYNNDSIAAYEKMGFKIIDSFVADIGSGFVMDDYIMQKEL